MRQELVIVLWTLATLLMCMQVCAQQVVASSGSYFSNGNVSLSSTVGETVTTTLSANTILTQGFQQPEYEVLSSVATNTESRIQVQVYPNPGSSSIFIDIKSEISETALLHISDIHGKKLRTQSLSSNITNMVTLNELANGQYFFSITDEIGKRISIHTIQKIK